MESKLIRDFYTPNPVSISHSANLQEAMETILENQIHHLPVINDDNIVVGILSDKDILPLIHDFEKAPDKFADIDLTELMSKDVQIISIDDSLETAAKMMIDGSFHSLPVVDNQRLMGIITSTDLLRFVLEETDNGPQKRLQNLFSFNSNDSQE